MQTKKCIAKGICLLTIIVLAINFSLPVFASSTHSTFAKSGKSSDFFLKSAIELTSDSFLSEKDPFEEFDVETVSIQQGIDYSIFFKNAISLPDSSEFKAHPVAHIPHWLWLKHILI
jgi:hypothetical protein